MQSLSTWISLENLSNTLLKRLSEVNVYSHYFCDIAVRRQTGIITCTAGSISQSLKFCNSVL